MFESLDFVYTPTANAAAEAQRYVDELGATLVWRVSGMGTTVTCLRLAGEGPAILLTEHLDGELPILVYRVADYTAAVAALRAAGVEGLHELEIPHGPLASFVAPGGQRLAVYERTRPFAASMFDGRFDD
jgi:hypothetical protein